VFASNDLAGVDDPADGFTVWLRHLGVPEAGV
jgi:hypothetical protein